MPSPIFSLQKSSFLYANFTKKDLFYMLILRKISNNRSSGADRVFCRLNIHMYVHVDEVARHYYCFPHLSVRPYLFFRRYLCVCLAFTSLSTTEVIWRRCQLAKWYKITALYSAATLECHARLYFPLLLNAKPVATATCF